MQCNQNHKGIIFIKIVAKSMKLKWNPQKILKLIPVFVGIVDAEAECNVETCNLKMRISFVIMMLPEVKSS